MGLYAVYLLDWLAVFHREQLLVLRLEDHASDVKSTMRRVFQFLSLGTEVEGRWSLWAGMGRAQRAGQGWAMGRTG